MMTDDDGRVTVNWDDIQAGDVVFFMMEHLESQRRIYDALLALLAVQDAELPAALLERHKAGEFLYPPPWSEDGNPPPEGDDDAGS